MATPAERLEALYAQVPDAHCQGLCSKACAHIGMSAAERQRIRAAGVPLPQINDSPCRALDWKGECSIYDLRPMICRLYGVAPGLECDYGCRPERMLHPQDVSRLLREAAAIAGE